LFEKRYLSNINIDRSKKSKAQSLSNEYYADKYKRYCAFRKEVATIFVMEF